MKAAVQADARRRSVRRRSFLVPFLIAIALAWPAAQEAVAHEIVAPSQLGFVPPQPGTYVLQRIMRAPEGLVLDTQGKTRRLSGYTAGKITLLSFIYTTCTDTKGCPYALVVLHDLKRQIEKTPAFRDRVRLVSVSFDPEHDTPEVMRLYGGNSAPNGRGLQWHFLTTSSQKELLPLLDGFGQDVSVTDDAKTGKPSRVFAHVLKVFLIDKKSQIREIYTTSFLQPQMMTNDIKTLLLEDGVRVE